jgi:DeoR/GlpR family transcriptional regulator of sugar metabolism
MEKTAMLTEERRRRILEMLHQDGKVLASQLTEVFDVSEDTIRRDLNELAASGKIQRVHGGALPPTPAGGSYAARQHQQPQAKAEIAQAAMQLIRDHQVILLDGGTTPLQVAQRLPRTLQATVITHSPPIATALAEHPTVEVIVVGGKLYKHSLATVGASTVEAYRQIRADICFLGICSLHPELGISTNNFEEAEVKRVLIASSAEVVALTSSDKLGTAAPYIIGPLSELTHLVTERNVPFDLLLPYQQRGVTIIQE